MERGLRRNADLGYRDRPLSTRFWRGEGRGGRGLAATADGVGAGARGRRGRGSGGGFWPRQRTAPGPRPGEGRGEGLAPLFAPRKATEIQPTIFLFVRRASGRVGRRGYSGNEQRGAGGVVPG